jgi:hypothetical protein
VVLTDRQWQLDGIWIGGCGWWMPPCFPLMLSNDAADRSPSLLAFSEIAADSSMSERMERIKAFFFCVGINPVP